MGKIYVGQYFKITLTLGFSIVGATSLKIKVKKANGTISEFNAISIDDETGKIQAQIQSSDNTSNGQWTVWGKCIDSYSKPLIGEPSSFTIYKEGY